MPHATSAGPACFVDPFPHGTGDASDRDLLDRFAHNGEETAFAALVRRHAAGVLAVCRRVLRHEQDAEDVCQAVFLLLARKAGRIDWEPCVRKWLCAAAYRLALRARSITARRQFLPIGDDDDSPASGDGNPLVGVAQEELRAVVNAELHALPEKYRVPVVLCYLEGKTNAEAARLLGWPAGSMSRRLNRARALLGQRLTLRGLALAMLLIGLAVVLWSIAGRDSGQPIQMAQLMIRLGHSPDDILQLADSEMDRGRLMQLAQKSAELAGQVRDHVPAHRPKDWERFATDMRRSAMVLADAAQNGEPQEVRVAVRNLNASCKSCHAVFRP